ncbi:MAG TPA: lipopolysaccharide biosynthesis protein [Syntrophorhabdus sp.]|jgi:O-antigen/teichoic acid export membrane protein|nr:lipopolysaccharide biosynthesis protein [Syntrophorhabdus sp.]OPX99952.1 MAG: Polysaccharide biosynthesis protein [Syntrophorhabdus sp. PtaB.Bin027]OQB75622.1 MAG: Polysaccharide biosynthesis protein [Deltaproteobacteria bacterium ADurb.Bin135]HQM26722.1 lipopolysaccharide biosynthesis protein [Syntrophorhabdus sp.]
MKFIACHEGIQLFKDGIWISGGHALAAITTLVGVRFITELAEPSVFGVFALVNGVLVLLQGVLFQPMAQAALRFYPDFHILNGTSELRKHLTSVFFNRWVGCTAALGVIALIDVSLFKYLSLQAWLIFILAIGLESWKVIEIVMRNAASRQIAYASLYLADSIGRTAGTIVVAWLLGTSLESLLLGQTVGLFIVLSCFGMSAPSGESNKCAIWKASSNYEIDLLKQSMKRFATPLLWGPIVGWISSLSDRYIIGAMIGLGQAGIYSSTYSFGSRPMLMIGAINEATFRQALYTTVSQKNMFEARRRLILWITINLFFSTAVAIGLTFLTAPIVRYLLAAEYRPIAVQILPWIAWGYVLLLLSQTVERLLYAQQKTKTVTIIQALSAALAILGAFVGVHWAGVFGVAVAVPFCFAIQMLTTTILAVRIWRHSHE